MESEGPTSDPTMFPTFDPSGEGPKEKGGESSQGHGMVATDVSKPAKCVDRFGTLWGDVHVLTFDGAKYDCQGEGEFVVMTSLDSNFQVQGSHDDPYFPEE